MQRSSIPSNRHHLGSSVTLRIGTELRAVIALLIATLVIGPAQAVGVPGLVTTSAGGDDTVALHEKIDALEAELAELGFETRWIEMPRDPGDAAKGDVRWEMDPDGDFRTRLDGPDDERKAFATRRGVDGPLIFYTDPTCTGRSPVLATSTVVTGRPALSSSSPMQLFSQSPVADGISPEPYPEDAVTALSDLVAKQFDVIEDCTAITRGPVEMAHTG